MKKIPCLAVALCALATAESLVSQSKLVLPAAPAPAIGNTGNSFPWRRPNAAIRYQQIYAASNFKSIKMPIIIDRIRFRAFDRRATTFTTPGGTLSNVRIKMSTAAVAASAASTTFANNHGKDLKQVYPAGTGTGPVVIQATKGTGTTVPGVWYIDVKLAQSFLFDPTAGKGLVVEIAHDGKYVGTGFPAFTAVYSGTANGAQGARVYNTSSPTATTGVRTLNFSLAMEINYNPASGLFASFTANPTLGGPNLKVTFKDTSFSSATGGIKSWAWDFDGDKKIDSTLQNPTHVFPCGKFSPSLTVTDSKHAPSTKTETDLISAGVAVAGFDVTGATTGRAPLKLSFTDKSTGEPAAYLWDFDGDSKIDSTAKNPTFTYTTPGTFDVSLTVVGCANLDKVTKKALVTVCGPNTNQGSITTTFTGGNGLTANGAGNLFDMEITNPNGLNFTSIDVNSRATTGNISIDVYVTPTTYVGKDNNRAVWVKVSSGTAPTKGSLVATPIDVSDFYLPAGKYGVYVVYLNGGIHYTNGNTANQTVVNCDLKLSLGRGKSVPFSGGTFNPRVWNGRLHYGANNQAGQGAYGFGCPGSNSATPSLGLSGPPKIGTIPSIDITGMINTNSTGLLLIGGTTAMTDLTAIGMPKCMLFTDVLAALAFANVGGKASIPGPIPKSPALIGVQMFMQASNADAKANTFGLAASNPLALRFGN